MRVGAYVDAYNLYYGMRAHCGRGTPGWRWPDIRGLLATLVGERPGHPSGHVGMGHRLERHPLPALATRQLPSPADAVLRAGAVSGS